MVEQHIMERLNRIAQPHIKFLDGAPDYIKPACIKRAKRQYNSQKDIKRGTKPSDGLEPVKLTFI
jgi:hypothetical protein